MESNTQKWAELLNQVLEAPGVIHDCLSMFRKYSLSNTCLIAFQCQERGLQMGPVATFEQWKKQGRYVRKGEKALAMWMPITVNVKETDEETGERVKTGGKRVIFVLKNNWFTYAQTDGEEIPMPEMGEFSVGNALAALDIVQEPYDMAKVGNSAMGYAYKRIVAVNPMCPKPLATMLHELGHVVLGHTERGESMTDAAELPRCIKELEAESVAMLVLDALGDSESAVFCRGYIQHWLKSGGVSSVPEASAKRIFAAADKILKAGLGELQEAVAA